MDTEGCLSHASGCIKYKCCKPGRSQHHRSMIFVDSSWHMNSVHIAHVHGFRSGSAHVRIVL